MQAIVLREINGLGGLHLEEVPRPQPGPKEAVVQIRAAALNRRDLWITQGKYPRIKIPAILGSDGSGEVVQTGDDVDPAWIGKSVILYPALDWGPDAAVQSDNYRILGMPENGTQAEFIAIPAENLIEKPEYLSFEAGAALSLGGLTGYRALFTHGELRAGQTVLITGAGGGVAGLILQMALAVNARVVVTSGSDANIQKAVDLGAADGVNYKKPGWVDELKKLAGNQLPDLIIDSAGGDAINDLISLVRPGGRIVCYGATAGLPSSLHLPRLFWKQIRLQGSTMGNPAEFKKMIELFSEKRIQPVIDSIFPFSKFRAAYEKLAGETGLGKTQFGRTRFGRTRFGKVVLTPAAD